MKHKCLVLQRPAPQQLTLPTLSLQQDQTKSTVLLSRFHAQHQPALRLIDNDVLLNLIKIVALYFFAFCDPSSVQLDETFCTSDMTKAVAWQMTALKKNLVLFLEQHLVTHPHELEENATCSPSSTSKQEQQSKKHGKLVVEPVRAPSFWMNLTFSSSSSSALMKSIEAGFMVEQNSFKMIQLFFRKQRLLVGKKQAVLMALLTETLAQLEQPIVVCPSSSALKSTLEYFLSNEPTTTNNHVALLYPIVNAIDCLQIEQRECLDALTLLWNSVSRADPKLDEAFAQHYHRFLFGMEPSNQDEIPGDKEELLGLCFARLLLQHSDHLFRRGDQQIPGLAEILDSNGVFLEDDDYLSEEDEVASETSTARDDEDFDDEQERQQEHLQDNEQITPNQPEQPQDEDQNQDHDPDQDDAQSCVQQPSFQRRNMVRKPFYRDQLKSLKKKKKREEKLKEQRKNAEKQRHFDEKEALNAGVYVGIAAGTIAAFVRFVVKITG